MDWMAAQRGLRELLCEWDPIGVVVLAPDDEYDCMIGPLLSKLNAGAGQSEIRGFLRGELEDHFGLDPAHQDVDSVADRLVAWWAAARARDVRYVCRWCGHVDKSEPFGRGRLCERCWTIIRLRHSHQDAASQAAVLGRQADLVAIGVQSAPGPYERYATRIAVVDGADGRVLADVITRADAWECGDRAALDRIGAVLADHGAHKVYKVRHTRGGLNQSCSALYWRFEDRAALLALLSPVVDPDQPQRMWDGVHEAAPWLTSGAELRSLYGRWYGEPLARHQPWPRMDLQYDLLVPGGTGDAIDDARAILRTCRSIADRTEPVSVDAPWIGLVDEDQAVPGVGCSRG